MDARCLERAAIVSLLSRILEIKRREVDALCRKDRTAARRESIDVVSVLRRPEGAALRLIAEVKLRSPSAGALSRKLAPGERAFAYAESGASMVSILCDGPFFDGSWEHLSQARASLDTRPNPVPVLAKEFVIHERQVQEASDRGADSVLLIARILTPARLTELVAMARAEQIEPLVEVVDERELEMATRAQARLVGVNARDLDTLHLDSARASRVLAGIPPSIVAIHFSGLREAKDIAMVAQGRADAALVGEGLMRADDPRPHLLRMADAARGDRS
jgi:indole-3-glycerol phosphate synthase